MTASRERSVETATLLLAAGFAVLFFFLTIPRLFYPFELTWLESYMFAPVLRCLRHESIYDAPSFHYTSGIYPPLYFQLSAWLAMALGTTAAPREFLPMRLLSLGSTVGVFAILLGVLCRRRHAPWRLAFILAVVYLAAFGRFEGWLDSSRVDSLMCLFFLCAVALLLEGRGRRSAVLAGIVAGLAGLTKQPALLFVAAIGAFLAIVHRQRARVGLAALAASVVLFGTLALRGDLWNPYFYYWMFEAPSRHAYVAGSFWRGVGFLAATLPVLLAIGLGACAAAVRGCGGVRARLVALPLWSVALAITTLGSLLMRMKQGASINYFMPVFALAPVAAFDGATAWMVQKRERPQTSWLVCAVLVQLGLLVYDPTPLLPTYADVREGERLVAALRAVDGPVWFGTFPSYARLAGKSWVLHDGARIDLPSTLVSGELGKAVAAGYYGAIVLPADDSLMDSVVLERGYQPVQLPLAPPVFLHRLHDMHFHGRLHVRRDLVPTFLDRLQPLYETGRVLASPAGWVPSDDG